MKYAKGIMWLDDCRIPFVDDLAPKERIVKESHKKEFENVINSFSNKQDYTINQQGRFTPNLLVCDDMLNDGMINKSGTGKKYEPQYKDTSEIYGKYDKLQVSSFNDKGTNSRYYDLDLWFDKMVEKL